MDTLSHYLWSVALYWQHSRRWLVGLWGAIPDLLSFGLLFAMVLFTSGLDFRSSPPPSWVLPSWVPMMYNITHSLLVCVVVLGLLWLWKPHLPLLLLGWPLHIFMDLPTHELGFFPTPLFWPLSDWRFDGFSWSVAWFLIANAIALSGTYAWLIWRAPRKAGT